MEQSISTAPLLINASKTPLDPFNVRAIPSIELMMWNDANFSRLLMAVKGDMENPVVIEIQALRADRGLPGKFDAVRYVYVSSLRNVYYT